MKNEFYIVFISKMFAPVHRLQLSFYLVEFNIMLNPHIYEILMSRICPESMQNYIH